MSNFPAHDICINFPSCITYFSKSEYERHFAQHFAIYGTVYDFVRKKIDGKFNPVTQIANMLAIFRYMKRNEDRFGMDIKLRHLAKVAQA